VDWTHVIVALIAGAPAFIASLAAAYVSIRNSTKIDANTKITESAKVEAKVAAKDVSEKVVNAAKEVGNIASKKVSETISEVKQTINGRMDELIAAARAKAYADGLKDGQLFAQEIAGAMKSNELQMAALKAMIEEVKKEKEPKP
jgi:hypothetical protein